jgi:UDP-N-acetylglucosamine 4-epimerase
MIQGQDVFINGDGETSRDFCFIENTVQANLLAATTSSEAAKNQVYNVAVGDRTTLNQLFEAIRNALANNQVQYAKDAVHREFRAGDVRHSQADISKISHLLGYVPTHKFAQGIEQAMQWYVQDLT